MSFNHLGKTCLNCEVCTSKNYATDGDMFATHWKGALQELKTIFDKIGETDEIAFTVGHYPVEFDVYLEKDNPVLFEMMKSEPLDVERELNQWLGLLVFKTLGE